MWYRDTAWVAYWDAFSRPERQPALGVGAPGTWWWDADKAKAIGLVSVRQWAVGSGSRQSAQSARRGSAMRRAVDSSQAATSVVRDALDSPTAYCHSPTAALPTA